MLTFNKLFFALAFLSGSAAVHAADGTNASIQGKVGVRLNKATADLKTAEFHYYPTSASVCGSHNGVPLSQAMLRGALDPQQPANFVI
ncbi:hypothetical protein [Pseudomonas sp. NA-150]|uniref:hypothetical protein n=1 Tax=Pseudomonas sp. NA-150 TaxID=3367525 RepID=UPI0037CB0AFD